MVSPPQTRGERSAAPGEHRTDRASGRRVGLGIKATANASGKLFVKFFTRHFLLRKSLFPDTYFSTPIPLGFSLALHGSGNRNQIVRQLAYLFERFPLLRKRFARARWQNSIVKTIGFRFSLFAGRTTNVRKHSTGRVAIHYLRILTAHFSKSQLVGQRGGSPIIGEKK